MAPPLGHAAANSIDAFLNKHCRGPSDCGELEQLRQLFTWRFRRGLERLLNGTLLGTGRVAVADVRIAWIDKNPIARAPSLTRGTELGDAVIFSIDQKVTANGDPLLVDSRAVILQAKIAKTAAQITQPSVPINQSTSTPNELHLLSNWPVFDLRAAGRSKGDLLTGVDIAPSSLPSPHAWFIAAPGTDPGRSAGWPSWWMAGRALACDPCTTTFGRLLVEFLNPAGSGRVGHPFVTRPPFPKPTGQGGTQTPPPDWSDLCSTIQRLVPRYGAPRNKFRMPKGQFGPTFPRVYSIPRHASAFMQAAPSHRRLVMEYAANPHPRSPRWHYTDPFSPIARGGPVARESDEPGLFVLTITTTSFEEESYRS